jgi:hypothetical protein
MLQAASDADLMARASSGTSRVHQRRRVAKLRTGLRPALVGEHFQPGLSTSPLRSPLAWRARPHVATRRQDGPFWRRQSAERSPPRTSAEAVSMARTQLLVSSTRDVPMFTCQRATPGLLPARSTPSSPSSFRTEKISNSLARGKPSTSRGSRRRGRHLPGAVPAACECLIRCYVSPRLSSSPHGLLQQLLHGVLHASAATDAEPGIAGDPLLSARPRMRRIALGSQVVLDEQALFFPSALLRRCSTGDIVRQSVEVETDRSDDSPMRAQAHKPGTNPPEDNKNSEEASTSRFSCTPAAKLAQDSLPRMAKSNVHRRFLSGLDSA